MHTLTFNMRRVATTKILRIACKLSREIHGVGRQEFGGIVPVRCYSLLSPHTNKFINSSCCTRQIRILHSNQRSKEISETTILLQQGLEFQEVPVAVLKSDSGSEPGDSESRDLTRAYINLDPAEEAAFVEGFNSYNSPQEVLRILNTIPSREITPFVSFSILKKLFELESNFGFRNDGKSWIVSVDNRKQETFVRGAVIRELISTIISSKQPNLLLDTLDILRSEKNESYYLDSIEFSNDRNQLCDAIFLKVVEGKLPLLETCRAICAFGEMEKEKRFNIDKKTVDKMWVMVDKGNEVTINNIVQVFKTLPYFTKSQRLVFNLLEKKMLTLWWRMDSDAVAQICDIISNKNHHDGLNWCISGQLLMSLSRCTSLNLHQVTESQLERIVKCFHHQGFCDVSIEKALGKYMKAKSAKIVNPNLIATIMDYAKKFRIRSLSIMEGTMEYIILHSGANLSPPAITSIITCFGHLDFQPTNGIKFWNIIEKLLEDKFVQFPPKDIVDIFLSCLYLGKHPLNFVNRIFSPYFLDRLVSAETDYSNLQNVRSRLKLLDCSLHLECGWKYGNGSPRLPKDFSMKSLVMDGRIIRMLHAIEDPIAHLCRHNCTVETSVVLPHLPLQELYIADVLILPIHGSESQRFNYIRNRISLARENVYQNDKELDVMCILIHIPEHYSNDGEHLIGPQAMRVRQLKSLGFKVASLKYTTLVEAKQHPSTFQLLLKDCLSSLDCPGLEL